MHFTHLLFYFICKKRSKICVKSALALNPHNKLDTSSIVVIKLVFLWVAPVYKYEFRIKEVKSIYMWMRSSLKLF